MQIYISLLRGINVGGKHAIKMEDLRTLYSTLGFTEIKTYIQSGNVIFKYPKKNIKTLTILLEKEIETKFGFAVPVLIFTKEQISSVLLQNPFGKKVNYEESFLHVTFLENKPDQLLIEKIEAFIDKPNEYSLIENVLYLYCPNGYSNCKFSNSFIEKKLQQRATTRSWKTCNELAKLCENN